MSRRLDELAMNAWPTFDTRACAHCKSGRATALCKNCSSVAYCGEACRVDGWDKHETTCKALSKLQVDVLRAVKTPGSPACLGGVRAYCQARLDMMLRLVDEGFKQNGDLAFEVALEHSMAILRASRKDPLRVGHHVPVVLLRLGRMQSAYDFLKVRMVPGCEQSPMLSSQDSDMTEDLGLLNVSDKAGVHFLVSLLLLKLLLFLDVQRIEAFMSTPCGVILKSGNLCGLVQDFLGIAPAWQQAGAAFLETQVLQLLDVVNRANPHFFSVLIESADVLSIAVVSYPYGSWAEAVRIVQMVHRAWRFFPRALDYVRAWMAPPSTRVKSNRNRKRPAPTGGHAEGNRQSCCGCCGAEGRVMSGCSCRGGRSHECLRRIPEGIIAPGTPRPRIARPRVFD